MHKPAKPALLRTLLALACLLACPGPAAADPARPNIILCMTDDQGWGDVSYNGHPELQTPELDTMAAAGIRFDRFFSAHPMCSPTRASCLSGRSPTRYLCMTWGHDLPLREVTIAEAVKTAGYTTAHFGKWHIGGIDILDGDTGRGLPASFDPEPRHPGNQGFDHWISAKNFYEIGYDRLYHNGVLVPPRGGDTADVLMDDALAWIGQQAAAGQPFLAVLWFPSPHDPHIAAPEYAAPYLGYGTDKANYYGELAAVDHNMGRLRSALRSLGIADDTMLWFCSDNGGVASVPYSTGGLPGGKKFLTEGGTRVPGILEWPARIATPFATTVPAGTLDFYPTVLDLLGITMPDQAGPVDGISLLPLIDGTMTSRPQPLPLVDGSKSRIVDNEYRLQDGRLYRFDETLKQDIDVTDAQPALHQQLTDWRTQWWASVVQDQSPYKTGPSTLWWDTDGATAGAGGVSPGGTWDDGVTANWDSNSSGTGGAVTFSGTQRARFAAGTNATGSYTVTVAGTVFVAGTDTAGTNPAVIVEEGNVTLAGDTIDGGNYNQHYDWDIAPGSTLTVDCTLADTGDSGSSRKNLGGTMVINGSDLRRAPFVVTGGTLVVNGSIAAGNPLTLANGTTLGGIGTIDKPTLLESGATLAPGTGVGTLRFGDSLTLDDGARLEFELTAPATGDTVSMPSATLNLAGQDWNDFTFTTLGGFGVGTYVLIDAGTITGTLGPTVTGPVGGFTGTLSIDAVNHDLRLTVLDQSAGPPFVTALVPADDATGVVTLDAPLVISFNRNVTLGSGTITIRETGGGDLETISVASGRITVNGGTVTIDPINPLPPGTACHVLIDPGVVTGYTGIGDPSVWNFSTDYPPPPVVLHEPFDYGASDIEDVNGLGGDTPGFSSAETWIEGGGSADFDYLATALPFGSGGTALATSGGLFHMSNTGGSQNDWNSRGIDVDLTDTIYGSFLWRTTTIRGDKKNVASLGLDSRDGTSFQISAQRWGQTKGGFNMGSGDIIAAGSNWSLDTTYLVLFKMTNLGRADIQQGRMWMLTSDQFDTHKASDGTLTEAELDAASLGTGPSNVLQRVATSGTGIAISAADSIFLNAFQQHDSYYDEIRISTTNLDDVTPLAGAPAHAFTYNGNGNTTGSPPADPASPYPPGAKVTVLGNTGGLARPGFTFAGWNTVADGSGTAYNPGQPFIMPAVNVTLHARWTPTGGYPQWAAAHAGGQPADGDANHNGLPNGIEYLMGGTLASPATLPMVAESDGTWTWTLPYNPAATDAAWKFQVSENLTSWIDYDQGDPEVAVLTGPDELELTLPASATGRKFARLVVSIP